MTILEARAKDVPALDDEFAKDTGKADTLDGLKAALRKELEDKEQETIDREAREDVLREVIKKNQIPVAGSLVDRSVEMQYQRLRQMLGMKPERGTAGLTTDDLHEKMRPAGADEVRGQLLLEAIADKESVTVTDEELDEPRRDDREGAQHGAREAPRRVAARRPPRQRHVLAPPGQGAEVPRRQRDRDRGREADPAGHAACRDPAHGNEGHVHGPDCDH